MEKRQYQQVVESAPPATHARSQRESNIRLSITLAVLILGVLTLGAIVLGVLSLVDMLHGHSGATWHLFTAWVNGLLVWLLPIAVLVSSKWWIPPLWKAYKAVHEHVEGIEETRSTRKLRDAATAQVGQGFNFKYANERTGESIEIVNPLSLRAGSKDTNNYYGIQQEQQDQIAQPSSALQLAAPGVTLHLSDDYRVPANDFLSARKLIVGMSGFGKSNTVGTVVEELGPLKVPMLVADTEDEYQPLCLPQFLPNGILADASSVLPDNAAQFGRYVLQEMKQVILNLQSYEDMEEAAQVMIGIIEGMRDWEQERDERIPSEFILEEAVTWLPQNIKESPLYGTATLSKLQSIFFNDMVRKGRKRGLGLTVVCQKIAEIDKRALQADAKILHYQNEEPDLDRYKQMGIKPEETLKLLQGDAFLFTSRTSKQRIHVRKRYSEHGANTPGLQNLQRYQQARAIPENVVNTWGGFGEGLRIVPNENDLRTGGRIDTGSLLTSFQDSGLAPSQTRYNGNLTPERGESPVSPEVPGTRVSELVATQDSSPEEEFVLVPGDGLVPDSKHDDLAYFYAKERDVKKALRAIGVGNQCFRHASFILESRGLKQRRA